jgi:hypothetical protein
VKRIVVLQETDECSLEMEAHTFRKVVLIQWG